MKISAGILFRYKNMLLLCKPNSGKKSLGPPKGTKEPGETLIQTACRETYEEIGIYVQNEKIKNTIPMIFDYIDKSGEIYKKVYVYLMDITDLSDINLNNLVVPKEQLQTEEIFWAGFVDKKTANKNIFHRFKGLLDLYI